MAPAAPPAAVAPADKAKAAAVAMAAGDQSLCVLQRSRGLYVCACVFVVWVWVFVLVLVCTSCVKNKKQQHAPEDTPPCIAWSSARSTEPRWNRITALKIYLNPTNSSFQAAFALGGRLLWVPCQCCGSELNHPQTKTATPKNRKTA